MSLEEQDEADLTEFILTMFLLTLFSKFYILFRCILVLMFDILFSKGSGHFYSSVKHRVCPELTGDCHSCFLYG